MILILLQITFILRAILCLQAGTYAIKPSKILHHISLICVIVKELAVNTFAVTSEYIYAARIDGIIIQYDLFNRTAIKTLNGMYKQYMLTKPDRRV